MSDSGTTSSSQHLPMLDIPRPFEALSDVSNDSSHNGRDCDPQESAVSERLSQPLSQFSTALTTPSISTSSSGHSLLDGTRDKSLVSCNSKSRKKSKKHKEKEKSKEKERKSKDKGRVPEINQEKVEERKSCDEHVPKPNKACEMSLKNLKSNSISQKSTGESNTQTEYSPLHLILYGTIFTFAPIHYKISS